MNAVWLSTLEKQHRRKRRNRRFLLLVMLLGLAVSVRAFIPDTPPVPAPPIETVNIAPTEPTEQAEPVSAEASLPPTPEAEVPANIFAHAISEGDTLSAIFDGLHIDQQTMCAVVAADEQLLALDVLRPGNKLTFTLDETTRQLQSMELFIHPGHQVMYERVADDQFEYREIIKPGVWKEVLLSGEIHGSFNQSALAAGLTEQEAANIAELFGSRLNFSRDIRAGDQFAVVRKQQFVDGVDTGESQLLGIRINVQRAQYDAFLYEDDNYYDLKGESLARAYRRYPFNGRYRITSPFNPRRLHPITHRISPHNGTDFGMPVGTAILSIGDGIVTRVVNHPFAGKYVEIQHGSQYQTRYLHLSNILVKRGQKVQRDQRIALSGNTGRSTGPHLHFELHTNGRVVDALNSSLPMTASIPKDKLPQFKRKTAAIIAMMEHREQQIATSVRETNSSI